MSVINELVQEMTFQRKQLNDLAGTIANGAGGAIPAVANDA